MKFLKFLLFLFIVAIGGFGTLIYFRSGTVGLSFFKKTPPTISAPESLGVGIEEKTVVVTFTDLDSGLEEAVVRFEQDGRSHEIAKERFSIGTTTQNLTLTLKPKELDFKEGSAELKISAFDRSFWVNTAQKSIPITIKYSRPRGEVLTGQQNVALGGIEPIFYRIKDNSGNSSGVQIGESFFPGYQAALLDPRFERFPDVHFALFALPYNFNRATDKVQLVIKDSVGNQTTVPFSYLVIPRRFTTVAMKLSDTFLQKVFEELLSAYFEASKEKAPKISYDVTSLSKEEKIEAFKLINESYRGLLLNKLLSVVSKTSPKKYWNGVWQRPMRAAPTSTFAETRNYEYDGAYASQSLHAGVDLADTTNAVVKPATDGVVLFADFFGIHGNALILDHGFGLTTLYGHLSSISVNVGEVVTKETTLGRSGSTGLAGGDHLHYEVRLHGVPVHPIEWWDGTWIREHIEKKTDSVFDQLDSAEKLEQ